MMTKQKPTRPEILKVFEQYVGQDVRDRKLAYFKFSGPQILYAVEVKTIGRPLQGFHLIFKKKFRNAMCMMHCLGMGESMREKLTLFQGISMINRLDQKCI